jgi:hypothetical protein
MASACSYDSGTECSILKGRDERLFDMKSDQRFLTSHNPVRVPSPDLFPVRTLLALCLGTHNDDRSLGIDRVLARLCSTYHDGLREGILSSVAEIEHYGVYCELNEAESEKNSQSTFPPPKTC